MRDLTFRFSDEQMHDLKRHVDELVAAALDSAAEELADLRMLGDALATAVEHRWTGDTPCDCDPCSAARAWRARRSADA